MVTKRQIEIIKILLLNWGENDRVTSLSFDIKDLTNLSNCLNYLLLNENLFKAGDEFTRITFAKSIMNACPIIFAHFDPNNNCLHLNFNEEELSLLTNGLKASSDKDKINEIGNILVEKNSECFTFEEKVKRLYL